jgi:hypothetical protein
VSDWVAPLAAAALHGPAGKFVELVEPHTEADPAALLAQLLVAFGAAAGRHSYLTVEALTRWRYSSASASSAASTALRRPQAEGGPGEPKVASLSFSASARASATARS